MRAALSLRRVPIHSGQAVPPLRRRPPQGSHAGRYAHRHQGGVHRRSSRRAHPRRRLGARGSSAGGSGASPEHTRSGRSSAHNHSSTGAPPATDSLSTPPPRAHRLVEHNRPTAHAFARAPPHRYSAFRFRQVEPPPRLSLAAPVVEARPTAPPKEGSGTTPRLSFTASGTSPRTANPPQGAPVSALHQDDPTPRSSLTASEAPWHRKTPPTLTKHWVRAPPPFGPSGTPHTHTHGTRARAHQPRRGEG